MLCPIAGYITYVYADWWLFFSIFVFGGIGLIISSVTLLFDTDFSNGKYLYKDEIETMTIKCQEILKLHKIFTILSTVLNLYPFIFIVSEIINPPSYYEDEISGLSVVWAFINIAISIAFVIGAFSDYKNLGNTLSEHSRIRKDKNCSQSKSSPIELQVNPIPVKEDRMKEVMTKEIQSKEISTEAPSKDIKLPKISGEYVENFYGPHSKLHIRANSAEIQFYFPGPDLRYNGTFFTIHDYEIDDYIRAYRANWIKAKELYEKAKELPGTTLRLSGERKMNIEATQNYFTIYLHQYHLPIKTEEGYQNIVEQLQIAKLRIEEIRNKLFV